MRARAHTPHDNRRPTLLTFAGTESAKRHVHPIAASPPLALQPPEPASPAHHVPLCRSLDGAHVAQGSSPMSFPTTRAVK